jgi:hypothetical protein
MLSINKYVQFHSKTETYCHKQNKTDDRRKIHTALHYTSCALNKEHLLPTSHVTGGDALKEAQMKQRLAIGSGRGPVDHITRRFSDTCCRSLEIPAPECSYWYQQWAIDISAAISTVPSPVACGWLQSTLNPWPRNCLTHPRNSAPCLNHAPQFT